jgi:tetratricopeptide (TPR) repeat protein
MLEQFRSAEDPASLSTVVRVCTLLDGTVPEPGRLIALAEKAVAAQPEDADCWSTLGAALYRAGRFQDAVSKLEEAIRLQGQVRKPRTCFLLAMAHERLGQTLQADRWLEQGVRSSTVIYFRFTWTDCLEWALLHREAESLLKRKPSLELNQSSWKVVVNPGGEPAAYQKALEEAEEACRLYPEERHYLNTLGVAQYRVGRYQQALETLSRSEKLNATPAEGSRPADLAFLAMTCWRLGQTDRALKYLDRLREAVKKRAKDEEAQAFLREAGTLLQAPTDK